MIKPTPDLSSVMLNAKDNEIILVRLEKAVAVGQEFYNQPGCCSYVKSFHEEAGIQAEINVPHPSSKNQWKTHPCSGNERLIN